MRNKKLAHAIIILVSIFCLPVLAHTGPSIFILENFENLSGWKDVFFPGISAHTVYSVMKDGNTTCLKAESIKSASAFEFRESFNPYEYPNLKWKWKIDNILPNADLTKKSRDDAPIRIYVSFDYNPGKADALTRAKYSAARAVLGHYPPHSSLNYVWSSQAGLPEIITSSYTGMSRMILKENGSKNIGKWLNENVNIISDYRRAFKTDPPGRARIGILSDTENTKDRAVAYITDIVLYR
jgi:hypothetical protein